jgi:6-phosphogluconolactonase
MKIVVHSDPAGVARAAADRIVEAAGAAIGARGRFTLVLAGGSTPKAAYERLANAPESIDWTRVHVFFGDERCVPKEHPDSNYGMAFRSLLSRISIPGANIHPVHTDLSPTEAASVYERELHTLGGASELDLVLLGMGSDGHTLSLFPGSSACDEQTKLCVATTAPLASPARDRVTLTFPAANAARHRLFLVTGAEKAPVLASIERDPDGARARFPAARILDATWVVDRAAAPTQSV